jgi:hypothetical protein
MKHRLKITGARSSASYVATVEPFIRYGNRADALVKDDYEEAFELASAVMEMRKIPIEIEESAA